MEQNAQNQITLISHNLCPYVQRAVIALEERHIKYRRIDIDLSNKPDWFSKLSPLGKVPVMVIDNDTVIFESAAIAEYVNEISGGKLLSVSAVGRARQRAWIEFASETLNNIGQLYTASTEEQFILASSHLNSKWQLLEKNLSSAPFFSGESFSLVDAAFAPVFRYFDLFEMYADFEFLNRYPRVSNWREKLSQRSSVSSAVGRDYPELLADFVSRRDSHLSSLVHRH